jgi:hypothetical protein
MSKNIRLSSKFLNDLEKTEIRIWNEFYKYADNTTSVALGIDLESAKSLSVLIASKLDILAMNRVIGLGLNKKAAHQQIKDIISRYKNAGVPRFFVQLHPLARPDTLPAMLTEHGFSHYNNWVKLYREIDAPLPQPADLDVREVGPDEGKAFAEIVSTSFGWPDTIRPMIKAAIGEPGWHFYMAYDNGIPIATGANYIDGRYCWIDFAATLAEHRGKGAQTALAVRRIQDANKLGCKWLVVETAEQTPGKEAPSYRNMIRLGFKVAYVRPNYIMKF